jgi:hypothetical protein
MKDDECNARKLAQYAFLEVFADDEIIDETEFLFLKRLALSDGVVDAAERRVLGRIFARVDQRSCSAEVWQGILQLKERFDID